MTEKSPGLSSCTRTSSRCSFHGNEGESGGVLGDFFIERTGVKYQIVDIKTLFEGAHY